MSLGIESADREYLSLASASADTVRSVIRQNQYGGHTAGLCDGFLQCNLVILPENMVLDFETFCAENPIACPLLGKSKVGESRIEALGPSIDLRTDLSLYNVFEFGEYLRSERDITTLWRDDFVAFAIGCSFTFERALMSAGIGMRHIQEDVTVPMFLTDVPTLSAGPFGGPTVVSMRPIKACDLDQVQEICATYPHAHGKPLHVGDPAEIGIADLTAPQWGAAVTVKDDELPVFWGCGVTTQVAIAQARPPFCITHAPGAMLITEIDETSSFVSTPTDLRQ